MAWSAVLLPGVEGLDGQAIQLFTLRLSYHLADHLLNLGSLPLYSTGICHMAQLGSDRSSLRQSTTLTKFALSYQTASCIGRR